jgi:hypothetical protein
MEIVYRASDIVEAHIVAGMLQAAGVRAHVSGHFLQGAVGEMSTMGFANVLAPEQDLELARELLDEYRARAETRPAEQVAEPGKQPPHPV